MVYFPIPVSMGHNNNHFQAYALLLHTKNGKFCWGFGPSNKAGLLGSFGHCAYKFNPKRWIVFHFKSRIIWGVAGLFYIANTALWKYVWLCKSKVALKLNLQHENTVTPIQSLFTWYKLVLAFKKKNKKFWCPSPSQFPHSSDLWVYNQS